MRKQFRNGSGKTKISCRIHLLKTTDLSDESNGKIEEWSFLKRKKKRHVAQEESHKTEHYETPVPDRLS